MIIKAIKAAIPLEAVLADAGVNLHHGKARCPFHEDRNPSFTIKGERWRCWADCGGGDVIDFAAKYYGLDTKGAIRLLADRAGIRPARTEGERIVAEKARREREEKARLIKAFRVWEQETVNEIAEVLRRFRHLQATRLDFPEAELEMLAEVRANIDILEYHYSILSGRDDRAKYELFREEIRNAS